MTRTKAWRLTLTFILGFGWLFLTPAQSNLDPLSAAAAEIQELNASVPDLNYKTEFQSLINIAESDYDAAVSAKQDMEQSSDEYDQAVETEAARIEEVNIAQNSVDGQTVTVADALTNKNNAQNALDIANLNFQTAQFAVQNAGDAGLQYTVYYLTRDFYGNAITAGVACTGVWNSNSMSPGSATCGRTENFIVRFTGRITVPSHWTSTKFAGYTDDGFRMYIDGVLAINNWQEQGVTWSPYSPIYDVSEDKTFDVEIWWYNGGGPGYYHLGWEIPGGWTGAGCDYTGGWGVGFSCNLNTFSYGQGATQNQINAYNQAVAEQELAQEVYDDKLSIYNQEVQTLQNLTTNLTISNQNLTTAQTNLTTALTNKNSAIATYDQSIIDLNNSISDAWDYYNKQLATEIAAAIAQALANQPQPEPTLEPTPEPTPQTSPEPEQEPSPEPTSPPEELPEQTEPDSPNPQPTDQTDDESSVTPDPEPEQSPKPQPEQSPQQEDINPLPTPSPQPEKSPALPSPKPSIKNTINELSAIANLTSKDNVVVKLTPEQSAAVANVLVSLAPEQKKEVAKDLGIKAEEIAILAEAIKENPVIAAAVVEFSNRAEENQNAVMQYTLADATTELQTEAFLSDPIGALTNIDLEVLSDPSQWGKDMTDDQREKAQEVIVPVIIASNIVAAAMTRRI